MEAMAIGLLWLHLMAIALAGAATFGIPVLGATVSRATADQRPVLLGVARRLSMLGRAALLVLLLTGPLLMWLKYGNGNLGPWFSAKMVLVLLLTANVVLSGFNAKWMAQGNEAARGRAPMLSMLSVVLLALTVLFAVMAFG